MPRDIDLRSSSRERSRHKVSNTGLWVVVVILFFLLVVGGIILAFYFGGKKDPAQTVTQTGGSDTLTSHRTPSGQNHAKYAPQSRPSGQKYNTHKQQRQLANPVQHPNSEQVSQVQYDVYPPQRNITIRIDNDVKPSKQPAPSRNQSGASTSQTPRSPPRIQGSYGMATLCVCGSVANAHSWVLPPGCKGFQVDVARNVLRSGVWIPKREDNAPGSVPPLRKGGGQTGYQPTVNPYRYARTDTPGVPTLAVQEPAPQPEDKYATTARNRWLDHRKFLTMSGVVAKRVQEHQMLGNEFTTHRKSYIQTLTGTQDTVKLMEENMFAFSQFNDARGRKNGWGLMNFLGTNKLSAVDNILGNSTELYAFENHPKIQGAKNRDHIYGFSRDHPAGQPIVQGTYKTTYGIRDQDSAVTASELVTEGRGKRPTVLNMANEEEPGGGALCGALAQEECLFRCSITTWAQHMPLTAGGTRGSLTGRYYSLNHRQIQLKAAGRKQLNLSPLLNAKMDTVQGVWEYPLDGHVEEFNGCILARNSVHGREYKGKKYITLPKVRVYDYITKAVPCYGASGHFPSSLDEKHIDAYYRRFLAAWNGPNSKTVQRDFTNRLRAIAWVGWKGGYDMIVLGPTGCGAFNCDPREVAEAFYQVFVLEFPGVFKHIEVAYLTFSPKDRFGFGQFLTRFINRANGA